MDYWHGQCLSQPSIRVHGSSTTRDAATLLPIIQQHLHPGSAVHSDEWAAYNQVQHLPNVTQQSTVYYSISFIIPINGTHPKH